VAGTTTTSAPTTTTSAPTTTTTAPAVVTPAPHDYRVGVATWYSYIPGRCATSYLPFGIHLHVRDLATGRVIVCITSDREEARGNRVVDLSETQFSQLAPLGQGVISVRVSW
jgi:rare lipoprotein A (peptidoglycan hydrolase)